MKRKEYEALVDAALKPPGGSPLDPRLFYGLISPVDAARRISIFQEFTEASIQQRYAYEAIVRLPATFFDPITDWPQLLSSRAIGLTGWRIRRMGAAVLGNVTIGESMPIWTLFTHEEEGEAAVEKLRERSRFPPLHISLRDTHGGTPLRELDLSRLRQHIIDVSSSSGLPGLIAMRPVVERWAPPAVRKAPFPLLGHFAMLPNQMVLHSLGYEFEDAVPDWTSGDVTEFERALEQSATLIESIRDEAEVGPAIRFLPPRPDLWLIAPAVSPGVKQRINLGEHSVTEQRAGKEFLIRLQRQQVYEKHVSEAEIERYQKSDLAQGLASTRNGETGLFAAAVGARTAGTLATTLRMPPSINLVAGRVGALAENIRSAARTPPEKIARMFGAIQDHLADAVGASFIKRIAKAQYGIKVVSDAPIEWLPIDGLPLSLETDVSRISATPGEITIIQLLEHESLRLAVDDFGEVLVVSAFEPSDRLAMLMRMALDTVGLALRDRMTVKFVAVSNESELIEAMNAYDGPLMVFDGHGAHPRGKPGHLKVGAHEVNVWKLRGRVRVPPIVVLSACDTHATGRTPMTTANAFLLLGARTVMATILPIGGVPGAIFVARLLIRIADYLPRAALVYGRVVRWSEVAGGMLRMQFLTDMLHPRGQPTDWLNDEQWLELGPQAGYLAGRGGQGWLKWLGEELAQRGIADEEKLRKLVRRAVPMSDTIRYTQLGNPETILIGDLKDLSDQAKMDFAGSEADLKPIWKHPPLPEPISSSQ